MIFILIILLTCIDIFGYIIINNYNPDIYLFKYRHIPFIWVFLFKYKKTYNLKEIKDLFYLHKENYFMYRNMQISKKELDLFIEENI